MRTSSLLPLVALAACGKAPDAPQTLEQTRPPAAQASPAAPQERIACARGTAPLTPACTLDRERTATGQRWTIRFPDGAFRRLDLVGDEVSEADGAEVLRARNGEAVIADERYRLPYR
jgi:hypothetical protein